MVNHQYFLLLQNYYLQIVFPTTIDKDGITPYLLATTGRRLRPPSLSVVTERMLRHPIYQLPVASFHTPGLHGRILQATRCVLGGKSQVKAFTLFLTPLFRTTPNRSQEG